MKLFLVLLGVVFVYPALAGTRMCLKATMSPSNKNPTSGKYAYPNVEGTVTVCFQSLTSKWGTLKMNVRNLRPNIKAGIESGGVHVHEGTSCPTNNTQLGHYFKPGKTGLKKDGDPWYPQKSYWLAPNGTGFTTTSTGRAKTEFQFNQGYGYAATLGKVIVIHDANTTAAGYKRIACGKLLEVSRFD